MKLRATITGLFGRTVETDVWPVEYSVSGRRTGGAPISRDVCRRALAERTDAELFAIAATIIRGWRPMLLPDHIAAMTDVDLLIEVLLDRAAQFEAVERDAGEPWLNTEHLMKHVRRTK